MLNTILKKFSKDDKPLSLSQTLAKLHLNGDLSVLELYKALTPIVDKINSDEDYKQSLRDSKK